MPRFARLCFVISLLTGSGIPSPAAAAETSPGARAAGTAMRIETGVYVGDGLDDRAISGIGFAPDVVFVKGDVNELAILRTSTMVGDASQELGAGAPLQADRVQSLDADGFTVGTDPGVNNAGISYYWVAFVAAPGELALGTYTGDGLDDRSISGLGFSPAYLILTSEANRDPYQRFSSQVGDESLIFQGGNAQADVIQAFEPNGFQVGADNAVNRAGEVYHWVAWAAGPEVVAQGGYAGDGLDDRDIGAPGFRPQFVMVRSQDGGDPNVMRTLSVTGDLSFPPTNDPGFPDAIQEILDDGFQVGGDDHVNRSGKNYLWVAFRSASGVDLSLDLGLDDGTPSEGQTVTYTLSLSNEGPDAATGIMVSDFLPAGVTFESASAGQGSYDDGTGIWTVGAVANDSTATLLIDVTVDAGQTGQPPILNTASITAVDQRDFFGANDSDSASLYVPVADILLEESRPDFTPTEGETIPYTIRVVNLGPDSTDVVVDDPLPSGLTFLADSTSQGTYDPGLGRWTVGGVAVGDTATLRIEATPDSGTAGALITNVAAIFESGGADSNSTNDADSSGVIVQLPEIRVLSGTYLGDGTSGRTFTGLGFQPDLVIVKGDNLESSVARARTMEGDASKPLAGRTSIDTGRIQSLDPDGFTLGPDPEVNDAGVTYYWEAFLEAPDLLRLGIYTGNGQDNRSIVGLGFQPDYVMLLPQEGKDATQRFADMVGDASMLFGPDSLVSDRIQAFEADGFQVGKNGDVNANGKLFHFAAWNASAGRIAIGSYAGDGQDDREITSPGFRPAVVLVTQEVAATAQHHESLPTDFTLPFDFATGFADGIQALTTTGFEVGRDDRVNRNGKVHHYLVARDGLEADLSIAKSVDDSEPNEGDSVVFTVSVSNLGPSAATAVAISDLLPIGVTYQSDTPSQGSYDDGSGLWTVGALPNGGSATLAITALVDPGTGGAIVTNVASVSAVDQRDPLATNDTDSAQIDVQLADLALAKTVSDLTPGETENVEYRLRIVNLGPDPATGAIVTDSLPAGVTYVGDDASQGSYDPGLGLWTVGTIAPGDTVSLDIEVSIDTGTVDSTITNDANVTAEPADPDSGNDMDSVAITVQDPELRVVTGSYVGDGMPGRSIIGVGFQPDLLIVKGDGGTAAIVRSATMAVGSSKELGLTTLPGTGWVESVQADGFTVGTDSRVNASGVTYSWAAFRSAPGRMATGSYAGNETVRTISGTGFLPGYVMVFSEGPKQAYQRYSDQPANESLPFHSSPQQTGRITDFLADGFRIGTNKDVNESGWIHHWVAWANGADLVTGGSYVGDVTDDREVTGVGFRPDLLLLTRRAGGSPAVLRTRSLPPDFTLPASPGFGLAGGIDDFLVDGFRIGSDGSVNADDKTYYWTAFRNGKGADLQVAKSVDDPDPNELDTITYSVAVTNFGPDDATGIEITDVLPPGVAFQGSSPSQGSYDDGSGVWIVGAIAAESTAVLSIDAAVDAGTAGQTITNVATVTATDLVDLYSDNDTDSTAIVVQSSDVEIVLTVDDATPTETEVAIFSLTVVNNGPDPASGISVQDALSPGLSYQAHGAQQGSYDPGTGVWTVGALGPGSDATLTFEASADPGFADSVATYLGSIIALDQIDPVPANDADTTTVSIQTPEFRVITGTYVGDGTNPRPITGVGFQPDLVIVKGDGLTPSLAKSKTMPASRSKELGLDTAFRNGRIRSIDADGFSVGSHSSVNGNGTVYHWTAFLEAPGQMRGGSYSGNDLDDRSVAGVGFEPTYVMIFGDAPEPAYQRFVAQAGDASLAFDDGSEQSNRIQAFEPDGFQLGDRDEVNGLGFDYHYVAWGAGSGRVAGALYLGNGIDDRAITNPAFRPEYVLVSSLEGEAGTVQRPAALSGDATLPVESGSVFVNGIQAILPTGFEVGTNAAVNTDSKIYAWTAFRDLPSVDLVVSKVVDLPIPNEGDPVRFTVTLTNLGPEDATGVQVTDMLPSGVTYVTHTPSQGTWNPGTGIWNLGSVTNGGNATLDVDVTVDAGTGGSVITNTAFVSALIQTDSNAPNDQDSADIDVQAADLRLVKTVDRPLSAEQDSVAFTVFVINQGPDPATSVSVTDSIPNGLTHYGDSPSQGGYSPATGLWSVGTIAPGDTATLVLDTTVDLGFGGATITNVAALSTMDQADPDPSNQADSAATFVSPGPGMTLTASQGGTPALPGAVDVALFELNIFNSSDTTRSLEQVIFTNTTTGTGSPTQLDTALGTLSLFKDDGDGDFDPLVDSLLVQASAGSGEVAFDSLGVVVSNGSLVKLHLATALPLASRDGDDLDVRVDSSKVTFDAPVTFLSSWPVSDPGSVPVDGMAAAQLAVTPGASGSVEAGTNDLLALDVRIPANGYEPDVLEELRLRNLGTAVDGTDVGPVSIWGDGGDEAFDLGAGDDFPVGSASWSGAEWEITSLSLPVPLGGRRLFVAVDLPLGATVGRTIQFAIPGGDSTGVVVTSGNDGPLDLSVANPGTVTIARPTSVLEVSALGQSGTSLLPGGSPIEVFRVQIVNTAAEAETLSTLTITNSTTGPGTEAQLDADWQALALETGAGAPLGSGSFAADTLSFTGLAFPIAAADTAIFVVRSGASLGARDGDTLDLAVTGSTSVVFERTVNLSASWPLDPLGTFPVDGMAAAQIGVGNQSSAEILTDTTRNLALEVVIPPNGYEPDTLRSLSVANLGDAVVTTDITKIEAWIDDGDTIFEPAEDQLLGGLFFTGSLWSLTGLSVPVPLAGERLLFSCDVPDGATQGRTVQLALPNSPDVGLGMASGNDGPRDLEVANPIVQTITRLVTDLRIRKSVDTPSGNEGDSLAYTVTLVNDGPDDATGVAAADSLPAGVTYFAHSAGQGTFDPGTGVWTVGSIAASDSVTLTIDASIDAGTGGATLTNVVSITANDQLDPDTTDRADSASTFVAASPGISVTASSGNGSALPGEADVHLFTLDLFNSDAAPDTLDQIRFANTTSGPGSIAEKDVELGTLALFLDDGDLAFEPLEDTPLATKTAAAGIIDFDSLAIEVGAGATVSFHLAADLALAARDGDGLDVAVDSSDVVFREPVNFLNAWPVDPAGSTTVDGMAAAQIGTFPLATTSAGAGTTTVLAFDAMLPSNGYDPDILQEIRVVNLGSAADNIDFENLRFWGDGGDGSFDAGTGDDFPVGTSTWNGSEWELTGLALPISPPERRLFASVDLPLTSTPGATLRLAFLGPGTTGIVVSSGNDGPIDAAVASPTTITIDPPTSVIQVTDAGQSGASLLPGAAALEVFRFDLENTAAVAETLATLTLRNETVGPGTTSDLDADWQALTLFADGAPIGTASFAADSVVFDSLGVVLGAGETVAFRLDSGASLAARDGDVLDLSIGGASGLVFTRTVVASATWPVSPSGSFPVDGLASAQVAVASSTGSEALTESVRNLALDFVLPPNGYEPDTLRSLDVANLGDAAPGLDITRVEAWIDDGDGSFDALVDPPLGALFLTGSQWVLTGLDVPIGPGGRRFFLSCDIAENASEGRTVQLALPSSPDFGVGVASLNDGPRDAPVVNPVAMTIATVNRLVLSTVPIAPGVTRPGTSDVPLLRLVIRNTYTDAAKNLTGLDVWNGATSASSPSQAELDAEFQRVELRDGSATGPVVATSFFSGGDASFGGFSFAVAPGATRELFVTGDVAVPGATDGDVLGARILDEDALEFDQAVSVSASFPLDSNAAWTIDGMIAAQIARASVLPATLGPSEGPHLAFDAIIPRNGHANDVLERVQIVNLGTAGAASLAELRLWSDGGNGMFDAGGGDDTDLGALAFTGTEWQSTALTETIASGGLRLFASISTSSSPTDSSNVRLAIPVGGITVTSANDGPADLPVENPGAILLSTAVLLSTLELDPPASAVGDTVTARMRVRNVGTVTVEGIVPSALLSSGDATLTPVGGLFPPSMDLGPGSDGTFTWTFVASDPGVITLRGNAAGTEQGSGLPRATLDSASNVHRVFLQASVVEVFSTESMPFSINRGQAEVVPLNLTFTNTNGSDASDIRFRGLTVHLEDEFGNGIVPADLLTRVVINEGTNVYLDVTSPETSGNTLDLTLAQPVLIRGDASEPATLSLSLDVSASTTVPSFRLSIPDGASFDAEDATNMAPVAVQLVSGESYPIRSGLARVVAEATQLDVDGVVEPDRTAGRGQAGVSVLQISSLNPGVPSLGSDVRISSFQVSVLDSAGTAIPDPDRYFSRIRVRSGVQTHVDRSLLPSDGAVFALVLSPLLGVPVNTPTGITVEADLAEDAPLGPVRLVLGTSANFRARDANTGLDLPVLYGAPEVSGPAITIQAPAERLDASATSRLALTVPVGEDDVTALTATFSHPGDPVTGAIRVDSLTIRCRDQAGGPLVPSVFVDRARILDGATEVGLITNVPSSGGELTMATTGIIIQPGGEVTLDLRFDVEVTAPASHFSLVIGSDGVYAYDANLGIRVAVAAGPGAEFPLTSGLTQFETPARELRVAFAGSVPPVVVRDGAALSAATLGLTNAAAAGSGTIRVGHLELEGADRDFRPIALGAVAAEVRAFVDGELWGTSGPLDPEDLTAFVTTADTLALLPGAPVAIELVLTMREEGALDGLRLGIRSEGVGVVQPESSLLTVSTLPSDGEVFPYFTEFGSFSGASLRDSYSNFPNPFAAGREETRFAFFLEGAARVKVAIFTVRGEPVRTLIDESMAAGLHQDVAWDGRNGRGDVVRNGTYVATIDVAYDDGSRARELRKVAVVR